MSIMSEMEGKFVEMFGQSVDVINVYTRAQAIEDGLLVDASPIAREAGFNFPVAVTSAVFHDVIVPPDKVSGIQDDMGRLWDILAILKMECRKAKPGQGTINFYFLVQNKPGKLDRQYLKAVCGPGDNLEPVITIMLSEED